MKDFKQVIRGRIAEKGMTVKATAERANIKTPALYQMLNGKRKILATDLIALCQVLDLSPADFV